MSTDGEIRRLEREAVHDPLVVERLAVARERAGIDPVAWVTAALARANGKRRVGTPTIGDVRNVVRALLRCPGAYAAELNQRSDARIATHSESVGEEWLEIGRSRPRQHGTHRTYILAVRNSDSEFVTIGVARVQQQQAHLGAAWHDEIGSRHGITRLPTWRDAIGPRLSSDFASRIAVVLTTWSRRGSPDRYMTTLAGAEAFARTGRLPTFRRRVAGGGESLVPWEVS